MSTSSNTNTDTSTNGLVLCNTFLPIEVIGQILVFVDWKSLLSCRKVCLIWYRIIDSIVKWQKLKRFSKSTLKLSVTHPISTFVDIPFYLCFAIGCNRFGGNILRNPFGSGHINHDCENRPRFWKFGIRMRCNKDCPRFKHWTIKSSGGDGWVVETVPAGSQPLPDILEGRSCFATSYHSCSKEQLIHLAEFGLNSKIMDEIKPHFIISEWYARRWDCVSVYSMRVSLLGEQHEVLDFFEKTDESMADDDWKQVTHTFQNYSTGVRYILFQHSGQDRQYWAGHFGSKMAGGSVIAQLPIPITESSE